MDKLTNYRQIIQNVLTKLDQIANSSSKKKLETCLIFDENHDHYLWISIGWINKKKINNTQIHIRIKNERVYIEQDWTEIGIASELLASGISKEDIVLAFHDPESRKLTEFAVA
jgi:hypothetical protein